MLMDPSPSRPEQSAPYLSVEPALSRHAADETDLTVVLLVAAVVFLFLGVGCLGGLTMVQWRGAEQARHKAEEELQRSLTASEQGRKWAEEELVRARKELEKLRLEQKEKAERGSFRAARLVGAAALGPWPLLPLVQVP